MQQLLFLIFFVVVVSGNAQDLKVMTYNIRFDNPGDGENQWTKRREKVYSLLRKYDPDIFGVQEALHHQLEDLKKALPDYDYFGAGRDDGKQAGEYSAIFFKKKKFTVDSNTTFWLSETPDVPGSKSWDAAITRVATRGTFTDKETNRKFVLLNTHFDHIGKEARANSAAYIKGQLDFMAKAGVPIILTGDLNCTREDRPYQTLVDSQMQLFFDPAPENPDGTFCNFGVNSQPCRAIDYILHTKQWKASEYQVIKDNDGKNYPSDHLPVMARLQLN